MEKIKINTTSGGVLEKPLITAFKSASGEYVALDNEMNGTMGLPIILVSKVVNNTLTLIPDAEWNGVKEVLRLIISGNQVDYVSIPESVSADDMFFKQLTLPVASFDVLKSSYKPAMAVSTPVMPEVAMPEVPTPEVMAAPEVMQTPEVAPAQPVQSEVVSPAPSVNPVPSEPVMPAAPVESQVVAPVMPEVEVTPMPSVEPIPEAKVETPVDFTADKEAFLKACENMFDALVAKFNNK